jgi:DNA-binding phage protein
MESLNNWNDKMIAEQAEQPPTTYTTTAALVAALREHVSQQGIVAVSRRAGLTRDGLHKILTRPTTRGFDPISRVCEAVGFRMVATLEPLPAEEVKTPPQSIAAAGPERRV